MISEYEQYYETGGTYVLPVEVFNQLLEENKHLLELQKNMDKQYAKLESNWNELKEHFKKQAIDLEMKREDISADTYIDRKMFLKEVLFKMQEIESGKND